MKRTVFGMATLLLLSTAPCVAHAFTAIAWSQSGQKGGSVKNVPTKEAAISAAIADCKKNGGGADCQVFKVSDEPGFVALYGTCAKTCGVTAVTGRPTAEQARIDGKRECEAYYRTSCQLAQEWEETFGEKIASISQQPNISNKDIQLAKSLASMPTSRQMEIFNEMLTSPGHDVFWDYVAANGPISKKAAIGGKAIANDYPNRVRKDYQELLASADNPAQKEELRKFMATKEGQSMSNSAMKIKAMKDFQEILSNHPISVYKQESIFPSINPEKAKWTSPYTSSQDMDIYVDLEVIQVKNYQLAYLILSDLKTPLGKTNSVLQQIEFDCQKGETREAWSIQYAGRMATGKVLSKVTNEPNNWVSFSQSTPPDRLIGEPACEQLKQIRERPNFNKN